jgi:hypothetical protein
MRKGGDCATEPPKRKGVAQGSCFEPFLAVIAFRRLVGGDRHSGR